jgi:glucosamine-6-phosphate deaminase
MVLSVNSQFLKIKKFCNKRKSSPISGKNSCTQSKRRKAGNVFGIGRACHIAFWEPHFAADYASEEEWLAATHRIGANLHPLTIEQNAITSFRSNWTLIPCYANTVGPGILFKSDYIIGGADGVLSRGMQWQGQSLWMTLRYGPDTAVTSSYIPTLPGKLFFMQELAGPLCADTN